LRYSFPILPAVRITRVIPPSSPGSAALATA
jgi:hypothetical protein